MKTVLLTGGAGFIGSHMVRFLIQQGVRVINVDALTYAGNLDNLQEARHHPQHYFVHANICQEEVLTSLLSKHKPDALIHMAAESHVDRSIACADQFIQTNVLGTHRLLDATLAYFQNLDTTRREMFRFLHVSTDEVFGALGSQGYFTEESPYQPNSPYAASKAASDLLVRAYHRTYGLPILIVNTSNNYGPHQYPEKLIPLVLTRALSHQPLPVYGDGQQRRDWLYVTDHVEALWAVLHQGRVGESYCIGADNESTNLTLVGTLCDLLEEMMPSSLSYRSLITFVEDRLGHDVRYALNARKVMQHTDWKPRVSFKEGLKQTVAFYVDNFQRSAA